MAHENTVIASINSEDGSLCVDIFERKDGSYGFEEFRRDPEDPSGWFKIGHFGGTSFASAKAAALAAEQSVDWFDATGVSKKIAT